ncbi:MAG: ParB N-terminal domain-containing protein [Candidatus Eisenbacteria bacterium]
MHGPFTAEFELPDLRFVEVGLLVPHEQHDDQRAEPLVRRLHELGVLKNPPIVAPLAPDDPADTRFVVLDGANRVMAARLAGLPHMLVQVVRYDDPAIHLTTWHHALIGPKRADLETMFAVVPGLEHEDAEPRHARAVLARREAFAVVHAENQTIVLHGGADLHARNTLLNAVVDGYRGRIPFHRVTSDWLGDARARFPEVTALVVFPHFEQAEVLELAVSGERLPAGITRHVIPWRALRVNVPLDRLADTGRTTAEKDAWFREWIQERVVQRRVRFYAESTVLFDE